MERRNFIKTIGAACVVSPFFINKSLARDFSKSNIDPELQKVLKPASERYLLNQENFNQIIENNVLPKDYQVDFWDLPRVLYLKDPTTGEQAKITYFENGKINLLGYTQANYMMRDRRQKLMANMDLRLLDLLCAVQAWMKVMGSTQPLIITSGYRTKQTNSILEGSAKNSMHMQAKAIDFIVPELSPMLIGQIAQKFQAGGVGIYLDKKFNHLDTASVRTWVRKKK